MTSDHTSPAHSPLPQPRPTLWRRSLSLLRHFGPASVVAVLAMALPAIGALVLYAHAGAVAPWLRAHPVTGPFVCAGAFGLLGGLALAPTYALSALCGWSFGFTIGWITTMAGLLAAALSARLVAARLDRGRVMRVVGASPKWRVVHAALLGGSLAKTTFIVTAVRLAPFAPFSLTNITMGAMRVPLRAYVLGTLIGSVPRTAFVVFTAARLQELDLTPAEQPWALAVAIVVTVAVFLLLSMIGRRALAHATRSTAAAGTSEQVVWPPTRAGEQVGSA